MHRFESLLCGPVADTTFRHPDERDVSEQGTKNLI